MANSALIAKVYEEVKKDIILSLGFKYGTASEDVEDALQDVVVRLLEQSHLLKTWKAAQIEAALRHRTRKRLINVIVARDKRMAREVRYVEREER